MVELNTKVSEEEREMFIDELAETDQSREMIREVADFYILIARGTMQLTMDSMLKTLTKEME